MSGTLPEVVPFPTKAIAASAGMTLVLLGWLTWSLYDGYRSFQDVSTRLLQLSDTRGAIVHLDEVLTMSAMMAATTGEVAWIERYKKFEPVLTAAIETAVALARSPAVAEAIGATDVANTELVKMEYQSFELVLNGRPEEARAMLTGDAYATQKRVYTEGMDGLGRALDRELVTTEDSNRTSELEAFIGAAIVCAIMLATWFLVANHVRNWHATNVRSMALEREAVTDPLTGAANVRGFQRILDREIQRRSRTKQSVSLLALDLDHFKRINDTYGHDVGDLVLKTVAMRWNAALRNIDTLARVGGEEFTAILPETNIEQAKRAAERLHAATKGAPIDTGAGAVAVTVSIGISAVEAGENDARAALKRADQALYQAKAAGRDQYAAMAK